MLSQLDERGKVSHKFAITVKIVGCKYQVYSCKEAYGMCDSVISKSIQVTHSCTMVVSGLYCICLR